MNAIHTLVILALIAVFTYNNRSEASESDTDALPEVTQATESLGGQVIDGWRRGKIETAYLLNKHLNPFTIEVDVKGSTAYLKGTVSSNVEQELAREIALATDGIDYVRSDLEVSKEAPVNESESRNRFVQAIKDATITASVKTRFLTSQALSAFQISVNTEDAKVKLSGTVGSDAEKALAERIALNTNGVQEVDNQLATE